MSETKIDDYDLHDKLAHWIFCWLDEFIKKDLLCEKCNKKLIKIIENSGFDICDTCRHDTKKYVINNFNNEKYNTYEHTIQKIVDVLTMRMYNNVDDRKIPIVTTFYMPEINPITEKLCVIWDPELNAFYLSFVSKWLLNENNLRVPAECGDKGLYAWSRNKLELNLNKYNKHITIHNIVDFYIDFYNAIAVVIKDVNKRGHI